VVEFLFEPAAKLLHGPKGEFHHTNLYFYYNKNTNLYQNFDIFTAFLDQWIMNLFLKWANSPLLYQIFQELSDKFK
jgi:hypothetical protein